MKSLKASLTFLAAATLFAGCGKSADSFSLLSDGSSFKQNATFTPRKVDVLWVIDNSGSMKSSQDKLAANFSSFINKFKTTDSDFHMAVTTTDAYLGPYTRNGNYDYVNFSKIRDGVSDGTLNAHSGVFVMNKTTPNITSVFTTNITQGIKGSGDERALQSMETTLRDPWNSGFRRPGAYLAVIIVSDEDDFSHNDIGSIENDYYVTTDLNDSKIFSIQHYVDYLTTFTSVGGTGKNFSVSAISVMDAACQAELVAGGSGGQRINKRYTQVVNATGGQEISLCSNFSQSLTVLSQSILDLSSSFQLNRLPIESTLAVTVDGAAVVKNLANGWTYDAGSNSVIFHGSAIPAAGANVVINFDPAGVKN
ncbi:MAG: hypothetical protein EOP04_08185 [Proteobacteria bacterium]|nr:MAG: hypothetical protein EOP04_08185 [Pseudomonadota bacterium]